MTGRRGPQPVTLVVVAQAQTGPSKRREASAKRAMHPGDGSTSSTGVGSDVSGLSSSGSRDGQTGESSESSHLVSGQHSIKSTVSDIPSGSNIISNNKSQTIWTDFTSQDVLSSMPIVTFPTCSSVVSRGHYACHIYQ